MDININFSLGEESINNIAFIKALLIKTNIEQLNISYKEKELLMKETIKEIQRLEKTKG